MKGSTMLPEVIQTSCIITGGAPIAPPFNDDYALQVMGALSSTYGDPTAESATPQTLRVSHEESKNGTIINSAIIFEDVDEDSVTGELSTRKALVKLTYDKTQASKSDLKTMMCRLAVAIIGGFTPVESIQIVTQAGVNDCSTTFDIDKFLNKEH